MELLDNIQQAAIDENVNLTSLLMKCKLLAHRLDNQEFKNWIICELEGYNGDIVVPDYRVFPAQLVAHVIMPYKSISNLPIPKDAVPENLHDFMYIHKYTDSIASIENMLNNNNNNEALYASLGEIAYNFGKLIRIQGECLDLRKKITYSQLSAICTVVRGRVLDFTVAIQKEFPDINDKY